MFRSKQNMQQHSKEHPQNSMHPYSMGPPISRNDHEAQPPPPSTHSQSQTLGQSHEKSHHLSSIMYTQYRPSFISNIPQNYPSTSSSGHVQPEFNDHVIHQSTSFYKPKPLNPILNQSSSCYGNVETESNGRIIHQLTSNKQTPLNLNPIMNQTSSVFESNPFEPDLNHEHDQHHEKEMKLLTEVEIVVDEQGRVLRTKKITAKEVIRLKEGEKVLVPVNEFNQLLKAARGVCARYMTILLRRPLLCPPEAKDWREVKKRCGVRHIQEIRGKFSLPQSEGVDKVLFAMFDEKYRALKYRFKQKLFGSVAKRLNEADNIGEEDAQEREYTEDQILQALEIIETPENFLDHSGNYIRVI